MNKKSFTLLELIIVIVVIGVLATVAVPQYFSAAERARSAEGTSLLGALMTAQLMYFSEHGAYPVDCSMLEIDLTTNKYFGTVSCVPGAISVQRNTITNPGFGQYLLLMNVATKSLSCTPAGGGKCPKGF